MKTQSITNKVVNVLSYVALAMATSFIVLAVKTFIELI